MPRSSKASLNPSKSKTQAPISSAENEIAVEDEDKSIAGVRGKNKNASDNHAPNISGIERRVNSSGSPETALFSSRPQSILDQLPQAFQPDRKNNVLDDLEEFDETQPVSERQQPLADAWLQSVPYGKSPPTEQNAARSISGSPPSQPVQIVRGGFSTRSPPVSPPQRSARPVVYGGAVPPLPSQARASTSPYGYLGTGYGSPPVLPRLPPPPFYDAPDVDIGVYQGTAVNKNQEPTFVKFAPLPTYGTKDGIAILRGFQGEVEVLSYDGNKTELLGALKGLQGVAIDASFLTWDQGNDFFKDQRPLIAITIQEAPTADLDPNGRRKSRLLVDDATAYNNPVQRDANEMPHGTRVEVYSLAQQCFIIELLRCPEICRQPNFSNIPPTRPDMGSLKIEPSGNFLLVSFCSSGEIFVFGITSNQTKPVFECLGKFWTSLQPRTQRRDSSHSRSSDADIRSTDVDGIPKETPSPIVALNGRWFAYCPASIPSRPSIGAVIGDYVVCNDLSSLTSGTPPSRPLVSCDVDSPDVETFLGKVARGVAQEVVRSTKWLGEKGLQTWQAYWSKESTNPNTATTHFTPPGYSTQPQFGQFPPTHADDNMTASKDPDLVAIIDLKAIQEDRKKNTLNSFTPLATFQPPNSCSFLSFVPNGLGLLTASKKGDVQYVWDLMQLKHPKANGTGLENEQLRSGGCVRQIAKYERLSPSTIVDIAWEVPSGTRFALLTLNRTIHIFDLPPNAYKWPAARNVKKHRPLSAPINGPPYKQRDNPPPAGFLASAMSIAGRTQPILANIRGRAPSMNSGLSGLGSSGFGLASATGVKSGKAVAAGLSKSLGAASETVTSIRHAGQSRLHLKAYSVAGRLVWYSREQSPRLLVLDPQSIKNYFLRRTKPRENRLRETVTVFDARKAVAVKLSNVKQTRRRTESQPEQRQPALEGPGNDETALSGFWIPKAATQAPNLGDLPPLGYAEIDTTAPYQPFHSDPRVTLAVYDDTDLLAESQLPTASTIFTAVPEIQTKSLTRPEEWLFGNDISAVKLSVFSSEQDEEKQQGGSVIYRETTVASGAAGDGADQIVSTTRRRKAKRGVLGQDMSTGDIGHEGFFEDDCDVLDFAEDRV